MASTKRMGRIVALSIAAWLAAAISASAGSLFAARGGSPSPLLAAAAFVPIAAFAAGLWLSPAFRGLVLSIDPRLLTAIHSWRILGVVFLLLAFRGVLPDTFALPAGWGDIAIGVTAPLVAIRLADRAHRRSFIAWQALGLADLAKAISLGLLAPVLGQGPTMAPMTVLPLSLVPSFIVPLLAILHLAALFQAARSPAESGGRPEWRPGESPVTQAG